MIVSRCYSDWAFQKCNITDPRVPKSRECVKTRLEIIPLMIHDITSIDCHRDDATIGPKSDPEKLDTLLL